MFLKRNIGFEFGAKKAEPIKLMSFGEKLICPMVSSGHCYKIFTFVTLALAFLKYSNKTGYFR